MIRFILAQSFCLQTICMVVKVVIRRTFIFFYFCNYQVIWGGKLSVKNLKFQLNFQGCKTLHCNGDITKKMAKEKSFSGECF